MSVVVFENVLPESEKLHVGLSGSPVSLGAEEFNVGTDSRVARQIDYASLTSDHETW